jgi:hypothetical protein
MLGMFAMADGNSKLDLGTLVTSQLFRTSRMPHVGLATLALVAFLAVAALFGGWGLMHPAPDGSGLGMPAAWLEGSPFGSYFIPGLLLFGVFGVGSLVTLALAALRSSFAPYLAFAIGVGQMIWIVVELAIMTKAGLSFLQPFCFTLGTAIALLAYAWWRRVCLPVLRFSQ